MPNQHPPIGTVVLLENSQKALMLLSMLMEVL